MTNETWSRILSGISVTIMPDGKGGMVMQATGPFPMKRSGDVQMSVRNAVSAERIKAIQMPGIFVEAMMERSIRQLAEDIAREEGGEDVQV